MVKSYLRYEQASSFGVIASESNIVWLPSTSTGGSAGRVVVGGLEETLTWDVKTGELLSRYKDEVALTANSFKPPPEVTRLAYDSNTDLVAGGYSDGSIRVWDSKSSTLIVTFNGHKSAVSALNFDKLGTRLVSGSKDSNIIVWDLVGEVGLYRLRSHRDQVSEVKFIDTQSNDDGEGEYEKWLISTSKDGLIKLWDLDTQFCIETHVAHRGECWGFDINPSSQKNVLVTAGNGKELNVWKLDLANEGEKKKIAMWGTLLKQSNERGVDIKFKMDTYFAVSNADRSIEVWKLRNNDEIKRSVARKLKRRKDKKKESEEEKNGEEKLPSEDDVGENFVSMTIVRPPSKARHFSWSPVTRTNYLELIVSLRNNSLEVYRIPTSTSGSAVKQYTIELAGHREDVRSLSLSSDDRLVCSASNGLLKVWNVKTMNCLRTFECGYALCASFLPGDALIIVGTKEGHIELFDVASSSLLERIEGAHSGSIWSLHINRTETGTTMVTGGADKLVKFWEFKVVQSIVPGSGEKISQMKLKHKRTLELTDDVLSVKVSPNGKLVACSLLDNTIKVFFVDTLKFYLNLYGHKLPVLSLDISHDSKLLISCSADKNIKIWGLDFGDCHKSIFAHDDSIMSVVFEKTEKDYTDFDAEQGKVSHNFFSASKDKTIKYWDGDKFERIQQLDGHNGPVWALAVAHAGNFIVSASHDKSIRVWNQTDEQLFIEEEREKEMENMYETSLTERYELEEPLETKKGNDDDDDANEKKEQEESNVDRAGKQTLETLKAGERLIEALDIGWKDYQDSIDGNNNNRHVILAALNISPQQYVLDVLTKIKSSQCEDALMVLPFDRITVLLQFIEMWLNPESKQSAHANIVVICRVLFFILRIHYKQLVATKSMRPIIQTVKDKLRASLQQYKDTVGYNLAAMKLMQNNWQLNHQKEFVDNQEYREQQDRLAKKRMFTNVK